MLIKSASSRHLSRRLSRQLSRQLSWQLSRASFPASFPFPGISPGIFPASFLSSFSASGIFPGSSRHLSPHVPCSPHVVASAAPPHPVRPSNDSTESYRAIPKNHSELAVLSTQRLRAGGEKHDLSVGSVTCPVCQLVTEFCGPALLFDCCLHCPD